jgi:hypothetical protein
LVLQAAAAKLAKGDLTALASSLTFGHVIDLIKGYTTRSP